MLHFRMASRISGQTAARYRLFYSRLSGLIPISYLYLFTASLFAIRSRIPSNPSTTQKARLVLRARFQFQQNRLYGI